jgi:hypothetical protein
MDGNMTSDGYFYFLCARSIVSDRDFSIEPELPYGNPDDARAPRGIDGKKYLYNHIGWPILLLPLTALGNFLANFFPYKNLSMFVVSSANSFITAFICIVIYLFSRKLKYSPHISTLLSLLYGFTSMAFPYATNSFCEPANTLMILLSLFWLYLYSRNKSYLMLTLSGLAIGYACFIRIWGLFLLPGLLFYITLYHLEWERAFRPIKFLLTLAIFLLPVIFMLLLNEAYFYAICGADYLFGDGSKNLHGDSIFNFFKPFSILPTGLYGLLFSTGKGIFFYNPVILLSLFNFRNFYLKQRREAWLFTYVFITHLFFIGSLADGGWTGDLAWGPRYLLPTIPFLILFLAKEGRKNKLWRNLLILGGLAGLIIQLPAILVDTDMYAHHAVAEGIGSNERYFIPPFSPIIGTWNMLSREIGSFSKDKPTGLSPWFFRLFDREIHTREIDTVPITPELAKFVWTTIFILLFVAMGTAYTILCLLRHNQKALYEHP